MQAQVLRQLAAQLKTYIRGVALPGEKPLFIVTPPMVFAGTLTGLAISLTATQLLVSHLGAYSLPFLPVLLALGQSAVAYLLMLNHQAAHGAIHQDKRINKAVAKISTVLSLGPAPNQYQERHLREHHVPRFLATERDPDYQFLFACGFIPGKSLNYYYRRIVINLIDPRFYLRYAKDRLMDAFEEPTHLIALLAWWSGCTMISYINNYWAAFFMYAAAIFIGGPISTLLQTITEHRWKYRGNSKFKTFQRLLPIDNSSSINFLICLYWRMAILPTDLQLHHQHHHSPKDLNWSIVAYLQDSGNLLKTGIWGIRGQFNESFTSLAEAPPFKHE